jgi:hypothetical protein
MGYKSRILSLAVSIITLALGLGGCKPDLPGPVLPTSVNPPTQAVSPTQLLDESQTPTALPSLTPSPVLPISSPTHSTTLPNWSIGIFRGASPFKLGPPDDIRNPVLTARDVTDVKAAFVSDPFMFIDDLRYYMFFEVLNQASNQGDIGMAESGDGKTWRYRQIVLNEPFHLSYPYVFKWQGQYYMIPESNQDRSVRLYMAEDFPMRWKFVKKLVAGALFTDTSVVYFQERWWMYSYIAGENALVLYSSTELTGPWKEHPLSPLIQGNKHISRPAGRLLVLDDRLYRFAQDDTPVYGTQVFAFEVLELSPTKYKEAPVPGGPVIKSSAGAWNVSHMHQVDLHQVEGGGWLAAVDGYNP